MSATSDHRELGYVFNEMTGVVRSHRRRSIALAMKVIGIEYASLVGVTTARTVHHPSNTGMISRNRTLGYREATWNT